GRARLRRVCWRKKQQSKPQSGRGAMMDDPLIRQLSGLASAEPDSARSAQIRRRCHARLARIRLAQPVAGASAARGGTSRVWPPLLAALGVVYFTEVLVQALRVYATP